MYCVSPETQTNFFSELTRFWSSFSSFEHSRNLSSNVAVGTLSLDHIATENVINQSTNISQDSKLRIRWGHGCGNLEGSMVQRKDMGFGDIHKYVWNPVLCLKSCISLAESFKFTLSSLLFGLQTRISSYLFMGESPNFLSLCQYVKN